MSVRVEVTGPADHRRAVTKLLVPALRDAGLSFSIDQGEGSVFISDPCAPETDVVVVEKLDGGE